MEGDEYCLLKRKGEAQCTSHSTVILTCKVFQSILFT